MDITSGPRECKSILRLKVELPPTSFRKLPFSKRQCASLNMESSFNNDYDYKASSLTSDDSLNNYPIKSPSIEENTSPTEDDLSITKLEISGLHTGTSFESESSESESLSQRIRKRDDDEESADHEDAPNSESGENEEEAKAESGENEEEPKPESGGNEEEPKPESGGNEEEPKPESGGNEEEPKPESGGNEEIPKPESGENEEFSAQVQNGEKPFSALTDGDKEENLPPPPGKEPFPLGSVEKEEGRHTENSMPLSTGNLEESLLPPTLDQEDTPFSKNQGTLEEDYAFQKKPLSSDFLKQKGKSPISNKHKGNGKVSGDGNGMDSGPSEFLPEDNWDEDSFYPKSFPSVWKSKTSGTIKPPQPVVSWNEFLVMQDKFQKNKLNLNRMPFKKNKLKATPRTSKYNLYSFVEDAIKRNKQIEKELMELKYKLEKSPSEQKSSSEFNGFSRVINNTLQLNVPLQQQGKLLPQELKIKIEAEAPLKIRTQVGDGNDDAMRINFKPLRLGQRSSEDSNTASTNKIQVREIPSSTKLPDMLTVSMETSRESSSQFSASTTEISNTAPEDNDPLKAERVAFIRKGAEFLRRAWFKYKQKRYSFLQK